MHIHSADCGCFDFALARHATDELLKHAYAVDVRKSLDPLNDDDFLVIVQLLADELRAVTGPLEASAVRSALAALDFNFATASTSEIAAITHAANLAMRDIPAKVMPVISETIRTQAKAIVGDTKISAARTFSLTIPTTFDVQDARVVDAIARLGSWVTDEYGKRASFFATNVHKVIEDGLAQGLRNADIADDLRKLGEKVSINQSKNYWNIVATNATTRSRSYGEVRSFKDAGIQTMVYQAVLDERTTMECRALHGTVFPVDTGLRAFEDLELATRGDSQAAEKVMPFVKHQSLGGGVTQLYVQPPGGARTVLAHAHGSAIGQRDVRGSFSNVASPAAMAAAGVIVPPIHHLCRSTLVPGGF